MELKTLPASKDEAQPTQNLVDFNSKLNFETLRKRVHRANCEGDDRIHNQQARNIAFGSAGHLSKASKNKLISWRNSTDRSITKAIAAKLVLSVASNSVQQRRSVIDTFKLLATPVEEKEFEHLFTTNLDQITSGEYEKILRLSMAKFDKRLAQKLTIHLEFKTRTLTIRAK